MSIEVLGISGNPIKNSNTDRLIQAVLDASELEFEFVKLSQINVRPCFACKLCVPDNICKVKDDFPELAKTIKKAKALIIGAYVSSFPNSADCVKMGLLQYQKSKIKSKIINKGS